jgi:hypothetical protein
MGIVLLIVGYAAGLFAASNVLLPLFWAWPKARKLERDGQLFRPIPAARFVAPAAIWSLGVAVTVLLVDGFGGSASSYLIGVFVGTIQTGKLLLDPNQDMEADFKSAYESYLKISLKF